MYGAGRNKLGLSALAGYGSQGLVWLVRGRGRGRGLRSTTTVWVWAGRVKSQSQGE